MSIETENCNNLAAANKGAGRGYIYAHDLPEKTSLLTTMPEGVREKGFYEPDSMGFEKHIRERMEYWRKVKDGLARKK
ncbi:MAG: hypothetical protein MUF02_00455 [Acidobacteria bacterium]|nr:hypothetical protein [Acidobacteriota bacterium]